MKIWGLTAADVAILREIVRAYRQAGGIFPQPRPRRQTASPLPYGVLFDVRVWRDGGTTSGDGTTQCDRMYTAKEVDAAEGDEDALVYGTALTPAKFRPGVGELLVPATTGDGEIGSGMWDVAGEFVLWDANERPLVAVKEITLTVTEAGAAPTNSITAAVARDGVAGGEVTIVGDDYGGGAGDQIIGIEFHGTTIAEIHHWDAGTYAPEVASYDLTAGGRYLHVDRAGHVLYQDNTP